MDTTSTPAEGFGPRPDEDALRYLNGRKEARRRSAHLAGTHSLFVLLLQTALRARFRIAPAGGWRDRFLFEVERWFFRRATSGQRSTDPRYEVYLRNARLSPAQLRRQAREALLQRDLPGLQIYTSVPSDEELADLTALADSLIAQTYPFWQWTVFLGKPPSIKALGSDPRVRVVAGTLEGLPLRAGIPNRGDSPAEYLGYLGSGSVLEPDALYRCAVAAALDDPVDLIYSDEDTIDEEGRLANPFFKPDWSPALLLSVDTLAGLFFIRWARLEEQRAQADSGHPSSARDTRLRLITGVRRVEHIPVVLCHLRPAPIPDLETASASWGLEVQALQGYVSRLGLPPPDIHAAPSGYPRVAWGLSRPWSLAIVIPNRDQSEVLDRCLRSLAERTRYPMTSIVVVDTGSKEERTFEVYRRWQAALPLTVIEHPGKFNFGAACNVGAARTQTDLILFLNNDTEALEEDWLDRMVQWFEIDSVGVVGGKLLFPDGRVQHAGVIVGMGGLASHLFYGEAESTMGIFGGDAWYRDLSAVTGACLMTSRKLFGELEGFDEGYQLNYQDIDFCLQARQRGWRVIYTPDARLIHHEGLSHRKRIPRADFVRAAQRWGERGWLQGDPFFNPNLSYMSPVPDFRWSAQDQPNDLVKRLMRRLPAKEILQLPDDLR